MNKEQSNDFRMFINTQDNLDNNSAKWNVIPIILDVKNDLDEIISRIREKSATKDIGVESVTQRKGQLLKSVALKVSGLSGILQAFAFQNNDMDLLNNIKVNKSDILNMAETEVPAKSKLVISEARERLEQLKRYGITEEMLVEIETSLEELESLIGKPRSIRNSKFANLKDIDELFREGKSLLNNQLDKLMLQFRITDPAFYDSYQTARTIVDL